MITIDSLKSFGANADEGLARCMNMESFYLDLVKKMLNDTGIEDLEKLLSDGDLDGAFEKAHALKGVYGNLSLTPIAVPLSELTDHLRGRSGGGEAAIIEKCMPLLAKAKEEKQKLSEM